MKSNKKWSMLTLIMMFWFTISFITNILGPLIPDIIHNFELKDLAMAGFIPTSFFLAYAIMSIPAGILIDKYGEKPVLFTGFLMPFIGTTLFACFPFYLILLLSSFIIGLGMAMLQTVINPLQRVVGGEENYAFIAELAQFVFGVASFISPLVYTWLIHALEPEVYQQGQNFLLDILAKVTPVTLPWVSLYWVFTALLLAMLLVVSFVHFPRIELKDDERSGSSSSYKKLFRQKYVWLFFLGIFCYVSTEKEINTIPLLQEILDSGKRLGVPKCTGKGIMDAYEIQNLEQLKIGSYGILEPGEECDIILDPTEIQFAIIPCISCNRKGERLGHGGGFYDRYLEKMPEDCEKAILCRESLMCDEIPTEEHDERMDLVISENGIIRIKEEVCEI